MISNDPHPLLVPGVPGLRHSNRADAGCVYFDGVGMTTLREAAQQALEALVIGSDAAHEVAQNYHEAMAGYRPARHIAVDDDVRTIEAAIAALRAALAEPVQEPPEFPPHDDKVHAGAIYWYVGTDGKYYSSNEVKLFMETKNKSLHYEPPKWVLDNFDLIPLYTAPPQPKEHNFCPRCGKRTQDIHTCTPP